jgi:bacillithiol biosynthesis cysteine-adding enzyme BshC
MEAHCVKHTELPGTSSLFADYLYHPDRVAPFYGDDAGFHDAAARIRYPEERRGALVAALREQNGESPALELLARPGTMVVATGQQVGLFSGPAYTIYKALTAAKLARRMTEQGLPAVPVFWLATEDHDSAEVDHCWAFDARHRAVCLELKLPESPGGPVGRLPAGLSPSVQLRECLEGFPFGREIADLAGDSYTEGSTLGSAFAALLRGLLGSFGLLYLDPLRPAVRALAAPLLREALRRAPDLNRQLLERKRALEAAGYHAQVHVEPQSSLVFLLDEDKRLPLVRDDSVYSSGDRKFSTAELSSRATALSPNALLRPVVQDYLLPTAAYVGGPAELAYLAQAQVLYAALLDRMPVVVPRASFTLLDARCTKLLGRYHLRLADFFHGEDGVRGRIAARLVPEELGAALNDARSETARQIDSLSADVRTFDPTLAEALERSRRKILYQFAKTERKIARESLRRNERAAEEAAFLNSLIYPEKHLQERFYSILPFLAKHGPGVLDHIYESIHIDCVDHQLLSV